LNGFPVESSPQAEVNTLAHSIIDNRTSTTAE